MRQSQSTDSQNFKKRDPKAKDINQPAVFTTFVPQDLQNKTFDVNAVDNSARKSNAGRESIGSVQSSDQMPKIQLSINKDEAGSASFKSNKSFRIAGQLIEMDE